MTQGYAERTVTEAVLMDPDVPEVYALWRDPPLLAPFIHERAEVELLDDLRSRWTVPGPDGDPVSCTAELVGDIPEKVLAWRVDDGPLPHEGRVEFSPHGPGTVSHLTATLRYRWPPSVDLDVEFPRRALRQTLDNLAVTTRRH
jgi:uncharacterized membrane protein